jgi:hypothetical protein
MAVACRWQSNPEDAMSISVSRTLPIPSPSLEPPKRGAATAAEPASGKSAEEEFLDYAGMTPAERMHAALLSQMGLTKEEFEALDPKEREAIAEKIREEIKRQIENGSQKRSGMIADISA